MTVTVTRPDSGVTAITVAGELDAFTADTLREHVVGEIDQLACRTLRVDLGGVAFLGAAGIGALAAGHTRASVRRVVVDLVATSRVALRALRITGVGRCFDSWPSAPVEPRSSTSAASHADRLLR